MARYANDPRSKKKLRIKQKLVRNAPASFLAYCFTFKDNAWVRARLLDNIKS